MESDPRACPTQYLQQQNTFMCRDEEYNTNTCMLVGKACVDARVRACVSVWYSGLFSRISIETLQVRSALSTVSHVFLLLLYLRVVTDSQMCMPEHVWRKIKIKIKTKTKEYSLAKRTTESHVV